MQITDSFHADRISQHRGKTAEGYLIALGVPIARTGYQTYRASELKLNDLPPDTMINVYRDHSEVFDPATIASFEGKSVTSPHPPSFLTPDNDKEYSVGHAQNVRKGAVLPDGEHSLIADLIIKDSRLINYIDHGAIDEISCGYTYDLVAMQDESSNNEIRYAMKGIRGNHVAIVPSGRAGSAVRVLDANPEKGDEVMEFKDFVEGMKSLGLRLVGSDANSETVESQEEIARKSKEQRMRTADAEAEKEKEKEEKKAKDAFEKEEKEKGEKKEASDARDKRMDRIADALEEMVKAKKEGKDDKEEKEEKEIDDELIPVETLSKEDVPKNPIPGADSALASLRAIKPAIASISDPVLRKQAATDWNNALVALKGKGNGNGSYEAADRARVGESKEAKEQRERTAQDSSPKKISSDFEAAVAKYKGKNPADVQAATN